MKSECDGDRRGDERLDQDMRKDDERQRSEEAASHLAGPARLSVSSLTTHYASQTGASEVSASCRRPRPSAERSGNEVRDRQDAG